MFCPLKGHHLQYSQTRRGVFPLFIVRPTKRQWANLICFKLAIFAPQRDRTRPRDRGCQLTFIVDEFSLCFICMHLHQIVIKFSLLHS